jgi:hypothetical protein
VRGRWIDVAIGETPSNVREEASPHGLRSGPSISARELYERVARSAGARSIARSPGPPAEPCRPPRRPPRNIGSIGHMGHVGHIGHIGHIVHIVHIERIGHMGSRPPMRHGLSHRSSAHSSTGRVLHNAGRLPRFHGASGMGHRASGMGHGPWLASDFPIPSECVRIRIPEIRAEKAEFEFVNSWIFEVPTSRIPEFVNS